MVAIEELECEDVHEKVGTPVLEVIAPISVEEDEGTQTIQTSFVESVVFI